MFFFFKQKTAYEIRISDWSSDVCSSDLSASLRSTRNLKGSIFIRLQMRRKGIKPTGLPCQTLSSVLLASPGKAFFISNRFAHVSRTQYQKRSEEHTSELQSLMRISYAVFCLKKQKTKN